MPTLIEKIQANAEAKLVLPPGRLPGQELARYKTFLKVESHRLKIVHRGGGSGRMVCRGRAAMMDALLEHMWNSIKASFTPQMQREFPKVALVAVGGYGRGELNPQSDIDFLFLHEAQVGAGNRPLPVLARMMDGILYPLWDLGLKVGYAVRNVDESVAAANADMLSKTALVEARLVVGNAALFKALEKAVAKKCVHGFENAYIAERLEDQAARHVKYGNSPFMQEPNIKNGVGGLRDFQNLQWMAFFKYGTKSLAELKERDLLSLAEERDLEAAYDYLLRVRNDLHYNVERPVDALVKNQQPAVAHNLGFTDRAPAVRLEKFMREYYIHARNIYLINRTLEQRLALLPAPKRLQFIRGLIPRRRKAEPEAVDGFLFVDGHIQAANNRVFRDQPRRLMRVFLHAQQRGLRLHPDLAQLIRSQLALANREFLKDEHVRESFLAILSQRGNVSPILRQMHEVGLLGKYMPEFGKIFCLVQHEFYHQYATDEHTLVCLEKLDRVWEAKEKPYSEYAELFQNLERPHLLYLALLLHDVGKSNSHGKHEEDSSRMALVAARRLGLDGSAVHMLRLVIENHILMSIVSQRRDMEDASVIRAFANQVQNMETLNHLTLHTLADSLGTSDSLWNDFKDSLLWSLYRRAKDILTGEKKSDLLAEKQRELMADEIAVSLPGKMSEEELRAHFAKLPPRYFEIHSAKAIRRDLTLAHRFLHLQFDDNSSPLEPVVDWHNEPDRGYTVVKICTWDRAALFHQIAGSFSAAGLNILSAQVFTRADDIAFDSFFVTDARTGSLANREEREKFEALLTKSLTGGEVDFATMVRKKSGAKPVYQSYDGSTMPTQIRFINEDTGKRTAIEVETEDRVGLLYAISGALAELDLNISAARIVTEKGAAIDTFYVMEPGGEPITNLGRQAHIERMIRDWLNKLG